MLRNIFGGALFVVTLAGCSAVGFGGDDSTSPQPAPTVEMTKFERAMDTVAKLQAAANEQAAIDRLTQLLDDPQMSDEQMAQALLTRAQLRYGPGNDTEGAIADMEELLLAYPETGAASEASALLPDAKAKRDELVTALDGDALSPLQRFNTLFELGRHEQAGEIMFANDIQPDNEYVLDMFQFGYLCVAESKSGKTYMVEEPDGTRRNVRFCDTPK